MLRSYTLAATKQNASLRNVDLWSRETLAVWAISFMSMLGQSLNENL